MSSNGVVRSSTDSNSHMALFKLKNSSPRLREVIRKRCQERSKEGRQKFVSRRRNLSSDYEIDDLSHEVDAQDSLPNCGNVEMNIDNLDNDTLTLQEELLLKQCELFLTDEEMYACVASENLDLQVICPICMKNSMEKSCSENIILCSKCGTAFDSDQTLCDFGNLLSSRVVLHNENCLAPLSFFITLENSRRHLGILCTICNFVSVI